MHVHVFVVNGESPWCMTQCNIYYSLIPMTSQCFNACNIEELGRSRGRSYDSVLRNAMSINPYLESIAQLFFNLWTVVLCSPLTIAFREEKFFTARQLWAMSIQWLMTLPRPSAATPPRMVAMTTSETRLKCSMQERMVGALSMSFGRWTYSRHWWSTTLRKRSCIVVLLCVQMQKNCNWIVHVFSAVVKVFVNIYYFNELRKII